ncbi:MAG: outer membrane lipoprotein carrier protein LolA [Terracidiphilus sp.]
MKGLPGLVSIVILLTAASSARLISAQAPAAGAADVHAVAQQVDSHYNHLHSLRAAFTESYNGLGISRSESGTLYLQKPGRMKWDYTSPAGKIFLLDGKYAWFWSRSATQVQRIAAKNLDDLRSPLQFLLGHTQLEKEFPGLKAAAATDGGYTLTGVPNGQQNRIQLVTFHVTAAGAITGIAIEEKDGAITRFTFTGEEPNVQIPESTFRFTPPPGVPVVDTMPPV